MDNSLQNNPLPSPPPPSPPAPTGVRNHIRTLRFMANEMTQQDLADRIGVSRQTLNAIEGSKYSPSLETAFKIARVFSKPLDQVFEYTEPKVQ